MLEAIIAKAIRKHLDEHKLIRRSQHGFSEGKFCLTSLLSFYRKVFETIDKGDEYDIVYLDCSKAFDRVPHRRLLSKVKAHGIGGKYRLRDPPFSWLLRLCSHLLLRREK